MVLNRDPKNVGALLVRANIYQKMNNTAAALNDFNIVLRIDPNNAAALNGRAAIMKPAESAKEMQKNNGKEIWDRLQLEGELTIRRECLVYLIQ
jgi:hypothetical protein